jgi:Protein of unknown function (DUF1604)
MPVTRAFSVFVEGRRDIYVWCISSRSALPGLSWKKKDANEFVPIWKQDVCRLLTSPFSDCERGSWARDEKRRRRLHGAFTGGFCYFNTVGSKEGASSLLLPILRLTLFTFHRIDPIDVRIRQKVWGGRADLGDSRR